MCPDSRRVFAECCSRRVGVSQETDDIHVLAPEAQQGRYAFESCLTLTSITFAMDHTNKPLSFFFHEYGRSVGMVPRSSLKEGKNSQMHQHGTWNQQVGVNLRGEKNKDTQTNQNKQTNSPQAESPPSCSLSSVPGETGETKLMTINGPEFSNEKHGSAGRCSRKVSKRLQMDFAS